MRVRANADFGERAFPVRAEASVKRYKLACIRSRVGQLCSRPANKESLLVLRRRRRIASWLLRMSCAASLGVLQTILPAGPSPDCEIPMTRSSRRPTSCDELVDRLRGDQRQGCQCCLQVNVEERRISEPLGASDKHDHALTAVPRRVTIGGMSSAPAV